jgi:Uma2 family endonuclease
MEYELGELLFTMKLRLSFKRITIVLTATQANIVSESEYLEGELVSDVKHELLNGQVYAMTGGTRNHDRIANNVAREFGIHLKNSSCEPFGPDLRVKAGANFYYPDVFVDCNIDELEPTYATSPVTIVEVLSKSTHQNDRTVKRLSYINMPSLLEYVLIEQDFFEVQVMRKTDDWKSTYYTLGDKVHFESIDLTLSVEAIYHRVHNDSMLAFLQDKNAGNNDQ